ncbi:MAG: hypothetical protein A3C35_05735 [Omnitrophica bacterium RIFCSPHIGHO2_02_FULL_46_11]|nr:MAG: hypothetical protein A3C35_05735 [Omnitrophica bacterium RIFCSPHIGHO2_02_FULL_46_11]OGW86454.1 MAG: hypothetical protein A3A81_02675 [Omnitrophica bacterium RIFCSPLOWO2_01_FULL_45_10b]
MHEFQAQENRHGFIVHYLKIPSTYQVYARPNLSYNTCHEQHQKNHRTRHFWKQTLLIRYV